MLEGGGRLEGEGGDGVHCAGGATELGQRLELPQE